MLKCRHTLSGENKKRLPTTLVLVVVLSMLLTMVMPVMAQYEGSGDATVASGSSPSIVDIAVSDDAIAAASLDLSQISTESNMDITTPTDIGATGTLETSANWYIIHSTEPATDDYIEYHEDDSNTNIGIYVSAIAQSDITVGGITYSPVDWIFLMNTSSSNGVWLRYDALQGTMSADGVTSPTLPGDETMVGGLTLSVNYISQAKDGTGASGSAATKNMYFVLSNASKLYVDDDTDFTSSSDGDWMDPVSIDERYDSIDVNGSYFIHSGAFPTIATSPIEFSFGSYIAYDGDPETSQTAAFDVLLAVPQGFPASQSLSYTITLTAAEHSVPA